MADVDPDEIVGIDEQHSRLGSERGMIGGARADDDEAGVAGGCGVGLFDGLENRVVVAQLVLGQ